MPIFCDQKYNFELNHPPLQFKLYNSIPMIYFYISTNLSTFIIHLLNYTWLIKAIFETEIILMRGTILILAQETDFKVMDFKVVLGGPHLFCLNTKYWKV